MKNPFREAGREIGSGEPGTYFGCVTLGCLSIAGCLAFGWATAIFTAAARAVSWAISAIPDTAISDVADAWRRHPIITTIGGTSTLAIVVYAVKKLF